MARSTITLSEVREAVQYLTNTGAPISWYQVQKICGGRKERILELLSLAGVEDEIPQEDKDESPLIARLVALVKPLAIELERENMARFAELKAIATKDADSLRRENDTLQQKLERLEEQLNETQAQLNSAQDRLNKASEAHDELIGQLTKTKAEKDEVVDIADKAIHQVEERDKRITLLQIQIEDLREARKTYMSQKNEEFGAMRQQFQGLISSKEKEIIELQATVRSQQTQLIEAIEDAQRMHSEVAILRIKNPSARDRRGPDFKGRLARGANTGNV